MKIWRADEFGDPQAVLKQTDIDPPLPPDGCVAVKVAACGVGLPDLMMVQGRYPLVTKPPVTPGQEVVGIVVGAGAGVSISLGERIVTTTLFPQGWGGFAEVCLSRVSGVTSKAPDNLSDEQAAGFLIPFHTAHGALAQRARLEPGETLLVLGGAGSSGSAAIQIGKALGATVIAAAGTPEKEQFCREQGADHTVNYRNEIVSERVRELTGGKGVNVIFDPVGGAAYKDAIKAVAHDGRVVLIGFASGDWPKIHASDLVLRSFSTLGAFMGARTGAQVSAAKAALDVWTKEQRIRPPVDQVFAFDAVPALMARLAGGEMSGKMVLRGLNT